MSRAFLALPLALLVFACAPDQPEPEPEPAEVAPPELEQPAATPTDPAELSYAPELGVNLDDMTRTPSGLYIQDIEVGEGAEAEPGNHVEVHYTGWFPTGEQFDANQPPQAPFGFVVGTGQVIAGWDEGVAGMRVGGKRKLVIPPTLAYGEAGRPGIPPNATLVFDVELLQVH